MQVWRVIAEGWVRHHAGGLSSSALESSAHISGEGIGRARRSDCRRRGIHGLLIADGQRGGETFFDNLVLAIPMLLMLVGGVLAALSALVAVRYRGERSVLVYGALTFGGAVTVMMIGELAFSGQPLAALQHDWGL